MAIALSKARVNYLRKFHHKKTREIEGRYLLEGWHLLEEALKAGVGIRALIFDGERELKEEEKRVFEWASQSAAEVLEGSAKQLVQIVNTRSSQGVAALVDRSRSEWGPLRAKFKQEGAARLVALDEVSDPGNCGTILRAASWFGLDAALFGEGCAELENDKVTRASMGAIFQMPVVVGLRMEEGLKTLQEEGFRVVASSLRGNQSLENFDWPEKCVLVIGNEARGISPELERLADCRLSIPRFGEGESLNAGVAASVFFANWRMG